MVCELWIEVEVGISFYSSASVDVSRECRRENRGSGVINIWEVNNTNIRVFCFFSWGCVINIKGLC